MSELSAEIQLFNTLKHFSVINQLENNKQVTYSLSTNTHSLHSLCSHTDSFNLVLHISQDVTNMYSGSLKFYTLSDRLAEQSHFKLKDGLSKSVCHVFITVHL